jgi:hypothetical protein
MQLIKHKFQIFFSIIGSYPAKRFHFVHINIDSVIRNFYIRSSGVVGEATALFPRSTPTTGSFIFREAQQRVNIVAVKN